MNAPAAPAAATLTFDEAHSAFLNSHPSDALNKPNDDVYRFDLSSDPTQNVAVRFSAQGGTLGITVNGEHYLPVAGQEVVIARAGAGVRSGTSGERRVREALFLQVQAQTVPVLVKSDGRTYIRVLGVGNVGEVKEKTINLAPGTYQFEASCKGYRTEIITVEISPATTAPDVQLQCKTRI